VSFPVDACDLKTLAAGRWAVGVSGGADSVALLFLLLQNGPASSFHIAHLDHETRDGESTTDAHFVAELAHRLNVPCTIASRAEIESSLDRLHPNTSARFRIARHRLFERVVREQQLEGVILAHHADDQAETVLQRLLRGGASVSGLAGMSSRSKVGSLLIARPLLNVHRDQLRHFLCQLGQQWREDVSNESNVYLRNRLRRLLSAHPPLTNALLQLSTSCRAAREWQRQHIPPVPTALEAAELLSLPSPLQRELARLWLIANGVPKDRTDPNVVGQLIQMARDAAMPSRSHFPGKVLVRRSRGTFSAKRD
jgi:tRNA(Ile)-lysidine synthetase-like protein